MDTSRDQEAQKLHSCPCCKRRDGSSITELVRHLRVAHGKDVRITDLVPAVATELRRKIRSTPNLPNLRLGRVMTPLLTRGPCDICSRQRLKRYVYSKSNRGKIVVCLPCREKQLAKHKTDVFASRRVLSGSFGSGKR